MYSSAVFAGVDLFALKFYLDRVDPQQPFLASKNQTMGYQCIGKIKISPPSISVFPRSETIPECDGQTDRQTDRRTDLP